LTTFAFGLSAKLMTKALELHLPVQAIQVRPKLTTTIPSLPTRSKLTFYLPSHSSQAKTDFLIPSHSSQVKTNFLHFKLFQSGQN
jgi:hypothetical protein